MKRKQWLKTLLAGVFLTTVLAVPLVLMASTVKPTLSIQGVELNMMEDGSAQMLFSVCVSNVKHSDGARLELDYNPNYLAPSDHTTNALIATQGKVYTNAFFEASPVLYRVDNIPQNPFDVIAEKNYADPDTKKIALTLYTRQVGMKEGGLLYKLKLGEGATGGNVRYVFNAEDKTVALGTVSFRVTDLSKLPEVVKKFGSIVDSNNPMAADGDRLIWFSREAEKPGDGPWAIGACIGSSDVSLAKQELDSKTPLAAYTATSEFTFDFPETIVGVAAAENDLSLDAYRGYTNGNIGDVAIAMQKYSPSVIATYADGSQRTFILPWKGCKVTPDAPYDPTRGDYQIEQDFYYPGKDGNPVKFPVPVKAHLAVTPIKLQGVSADGLQKTYSLRDRLVDLTNPEAVQTVAQFKLPSQARLVTDIPAGGATLTMTIPGWSPTQPGSKWPNIGAGEKISTLLADGSTAAGKTIHWPTDEDMGKWDTVSDERKGTYTFTMAETYGGAPVQFKKADIQAAYPWLTVPGDSYALPDAGRRLVGESEQIENTRYIVKYISTTADADDNPILALQVTRTQKTNTLIESMDPGAEFRILLPDGTELETTDWFADTAIHNGTYNADMVEVDAYHNEGYRLTTNPGDTTIGDYAAEREKLRRHINLGGWFAVSIKEPDADLVWSDFLPVYVPPRANVHTENKEYHFIGEAAGLFGWPGDLGTTVSLPRGSYWTVDPATGKHLVDAGKPVTERYGVPTTYDGATGAQPGELNTFQVDGGASWTTPTVTGGVTQYGPDTFINGARYGAYGVVGNPGARTATVRKEKAIPAAQTEKITLTYEEGTGGVSDDGTNVTLVTYDTRTQGYTIRQDVTLTINNIGTMDIYGLDVGSVLGDAPFTLLKPPASFLPAGSSTTFTLSYVYDLKASGGTAVDYRDTLYITSAGHRTVPGAEGSDYLLNFDAQFQVTDADIHRVLVKYEPADGCMGTARVIIGERENAAAVPPDPKYTMDLTAGTTAFAKHKPGDKPVYIMAQTEDEYAVESITAVDGAGATITLDTYTGGDGSAAGLAALPDGVTVYTFEMPDYDTTVTIKFKEPISSKLRLSNLWAYADETDDQLKDKEPNPASYEIWQKSYSEEELKGAQDWQGGDKVRGEYLMTCGTASKEGLSELGVEPTVEQYLVVIPFEAARAQVEVQLRKVVYDLGGLNPDIKPTVSMTLFQSSPLDGPASKDTILASTPGDTAAPTTHYSNPFASPDPGKSKYVRVDISFKEGGATQEEVRSYYLEIHRKPEDVRATLNPGNSPYGMIMNDALIDGTVKDVKGDTAKDRAKKAFISNGYSFTGLTTGVPKAVTDNGLVGTRYWTEAWVDVDKVYDPESGIGLDFYTDANNLDLSDEAFFAVIGRPFLDPGLATATDSSGRPVDPEKASISLTVITLDTAKTAQKLRFQGPVPDEVAARTVELELGSSGMMVTKWGAPALRPGLYELKYTFPDYDGVGKLSTTRPFVLLAPLGDVNADGAVTTGDETAVKSRITDPLGYTAEDYPYAAIFKFRSCDANNDRNINNIDANTIRVWAADVDLQGKFYLPTLYKELPAPAP